MPSNSMMNSWPSWLRTPISLVLIALLSVTTLPVNSLNLNPTFFPTGCRNSLQHQW
jgi:hypothetical protein